MVMKDQQTCLPSIPFNLSMVPKNKQDFDWSTQSHVCLHHFIQVFKVFTTSNQAEDEQAMNYVGPIFHALFTAGSALVRLHNDYSVPSYISSACMHIIILKFDIILAFAPFLFVYGFFNLKFSQILVFIENHNILIDILLNINHKNIFND